MPTRCENCGGVDESKMQQARCALRAEYRANLAGVASSIEKPPKPQQVDDLWAHLNTVYEDGASAHRAAVTVLSLGWRPANFNNSREASA